MARRNGHWYAAFGNGQRTIEWAIPAELPLPSAVETIEAFMPEGWTYLGNTWRSDFKYRHHPADGQPSYGQLNGERDETRIVEGDEPPWAEPPPFAKCAAGPKGTTPSVPWSEPVSTE